MGSDHARDGGPGPRRWPVHRDDAVSERPPAPWETFGRYVRSQRQLAQLSLRQLADLARVSNPYLSQIERGLHQPSVAVITALAQALDLSAEQLLAQAAGLRGGGSERAGPGTEVAIRRDPRLNEAQKAALLAVYRSMVDGVPYDGASVDGASVDEAAAGGGPGTGPAVDEPPTRGRAKKAGGGAGRGTAPAG